MAMLLLKASCSKLHVFVCFPQATGITANAIYSPHLPYKPNLAPATVPSFWADEEHVG